MATSYSQPDLVGRLAALGIHVQPGQSAAPGKAAQQTANFKAGITYSPANNGPIRQLAPGVRAAPANLNGGGMVGSRPPMQGAGPSMQGPMSSYHAPSQPFIGPGRVFDQQQYQPQGPQQPQYHPDVIGALRSFDQQNPWKAPTQSFMPQSPMQAPTQKPAWMTTSLWALYNLDRMDTNR